jgi:ABC-type uncharacterized transport system permease subunit
MTDANTSTLARSAAPFAALTGLTSLAILLQAVFAGEFINRADRGGWLSAHNVNAYVVVALAVATAAFAFARLRATAPGLIVRSVVLAVLLIAQAGIGSAVTNGGHDWLLVIHIPLALIVFGLTVYNSVLARHLH